MSSSGLRKIGHSGRSRRGRREFQQLVDVRSNRVRQRSWVIFLDGVRLGPSIVELGFLVPCGSIGQRLGPRERLRTGELRAMVWLYWLVWGTGIDKMLALLWSRRWGRSTMLRLPLRLLLRLLFWRLCVGPLVERMAARRSIGLRDRPVGTTLERPKSVRLR